MHVRFTGRVSIRLPYVRIPDRNLPIDLEVQYPDPIILVLVANTTGLQVSNMKNKKLSTS